MIVKELLITLLLFSTTALGALNTAPNVVFIKEDTLQLRGEVSDSSVAPIIDVIERSENKDLTLYIDSKGGSVTAGIRLLQSIERNNVNLTCVVGNDAASTAFFILQIGCRQRYVSDNSMLMQHFWTITLSAGTLETHIETLRVAKLMFDSVRIKEARRLKISVAELMRRSAAEWTMYGVDAVRQGAADGVVKLRCSPDLIAKRVKSTTNFVEVERSACPFVSN